MGVENDVDLLVRAIDYIENNLENELDVHRVAANCFCCVSGLSKTFRYVFHLSVKEYIIRRRISCAAKMLLEGKENILEVAVRFGYGSAEAFSRSFKKIWGVSPREFRRNRHFSGHTPKLCVYPDNNRNWEVHMRVKYDLTQLYEILQERRDCYYICADGAHLERINNDLGREAGDMVLGEIMRRIDEACTDDEDLILRVGGDEFVAFTNSKDAAYADAIVEKIVAQNGNAIRFNDREINVYIHIGAFVNRCGYRNVEGVFQEICQKMIEIHPQCDSQSPDAR